MYPRLEDLVEWLVPRVERVFIATNATLLNAQHVRLFKKNNIGCLASVRTCGEAEYRRLLEASKSGVGVSVYHVLTKNSLPVLQSMSDRYFWAEKIRLLYATFSEANGLPMLNVREWFELLQEASKYLAPIIKKVEVEMAFAPVTNPYALDARKGAIKRLYVDVDGLVYPCPLLVEKRNGKRGLEPRDCDVDRECPVLSRQMPTPPGFRQVCPFLVVELEHIQRFLAQLDWTALVRRSP